MRLSAATARPRKGCGTDRAPPGANLRRSSRTAVACQIPRTMSRSSRAALAVAVFVGLTRALAGRRGQSALIWSRMVLRTQSRY
jgi:hypothetical protein